MESVLEKTNEKMYENEFLNKIHFVESKIEGHETYGNTTEFYDEDGIVLMTISEESDGRLLFSFSDSANELYEFESSEEDS